MNRNELQKIQDSAASAALRVRERIERAIDSGEVPNWVLDACTELERSSLLYGASSAQLDAVMSMPESFNDILLH